MPDRHVARENPTSRRALTGDVVAIGSRRIRFDFVFEGRRYRPSIPRAPTETNLRRARDHLTNIKVRIAAGTFSFADEFPAFLDLKRVPDAGSPSTCGQVFDAFLKHCESRLRKDDMAAITVATYRRVLNNFWRPKIGEVRFLSVRYSTLVALADEACWSKTYNNAISVLRRAFRFGYRDHPERHNPAVGLKSARIRKRDRPIIDPFTIQDAEKLIAAIRRDWGVAQGNYDEFRFFTGLRPSEQVALKLSDFDSTHGALTINKARVGGIDKDSTKTGEDRCIELCPRALQVLHCQLALRESLRHAGKIDHDHLFFKQTGEPIRNLQYAHARWRRTLTRLPDVRYRKPYCARQRMHRARPQSSPAGVRCLSLVPALPLSGHDPLVLRSYLGHRPRAPRFQWRMRPSARSGRTRSITCVTSLATKPHVCLGAPPRYSDQSTPNCQSARTAYVRGAPGATHTRA